MAKTKISEWSATASSNTDIDGINIAEGCAPSGINDAIREMMSQVKDFQTGASGDSFNGPVGTTTAAAGAFTTLAASGSVTLSGGTANGVPYLNGSKVLTSGSALTFDGTTFRNLSGAVASGGSVNGKFRFDRNDGATNLAYLDWIDADNGLRFYNNNGGYFVWTHSSSGELMRLTSTGLGIGTSSPGAKLHTESTTGNQLRIAYNSTYYWDIQRIASTGALTFSNGATECLQLNTSGNLGLGVTPSAWYSTYKALQISSNASIYTNTDFLSISNNSYTNGSAQDIYRANGYATKYTTTTSGGIHAWYTAPSGTAGNAISFTQAMTLNESGHLLVGTTTIGGDGISAVIRGSASSTTSYLFFNRANTTDTGTVLAFANNGTLVGTVQHNNTSTSYNTSSDYRLKNITGPITNSGAYIDSLNPVEGTWKADGSVFVGLIAHEAQEASRTPVATGVKDGEQMQGMDYSSAEIIGNMIAELKSLRARLAALEAK
jgi:hypothetical protein